MCVFAVTSVEDANSVTVTLRSTGTGSPMYQGVPYNDGVVIAET
jgi:hypothetical protein